MISHSRGGFVPVMTMVYFQRPPRHHRQHEHRRAAVEHAKRPAVARARRMLDVAREADCLAPRRLIVWERFAFVLRAHGGERFGVRVSRLYHKPLALKGHWDSCPMALIVGYAL